MDFQILFKRIEPKIKFIAYRHNLATPLCGWEDLYQEICLYLWRTFRDGVPEGINESYIVKGCEFYILNFLRKKREKAQVYSIDQPINENNGTLHELLPDEREAADEIAERRLAISGLRDRGLKKRERQVLDFLLEGRTVREIGCKIGVSHVAVVKIKKRLIERWQKRFPEVTIRGKKLLS